MNSSIRLESIIPSPSQGRSRIAAGSNNNDATATTTTTTTDDDDVGIDLVVTHDRKFTANSGAWLIRNSQWSIQFLDDWWNMKTWIRRSGLSLSGDNAAFGHLIDQHIAKAGAVTAQNKGGVPATTASTDNNGTGSRAEEVKGQLRGNSIVSSSDRQLSQHQHGHIIMPARCNFNSFGNFVASDDYERQVQQHQYYGRSFKDDHVEESHYFSDNYYHQVSLKRGSTAKVSPFPVHICFWNLRFPSCLN